jgi:hypothetical protein
MKYIIFLASLVFASLACSETIEYSIYESSTNKELSSGVRHYTSKDLTVKRLDQGLVKKYLELEHGYRIGASLRSEKQLTGFGLQFNKTDSDFSWEWYDKSDGAKFVKRQGGTFVKIRTTGLPASESLSSVEFLDDTKFGFILNSKGEKETHYIIIKKGSVLNFN